MTLEHFAMSSSLPASRPSSGPRPPTPPAAPASGGGANSGPRARRVNRRHSADDIPIVPRLVPVAYATDQSPEAGGSGGPQHGRRASDGRRVKSVDDIPIMPAGAPAELQASARGLPPRAGRSRRYSAESAPVSGGHLPPLATRPSPGKRAREAGNFSGETSAWMARGAGGAIPSWDEESEEAGPSWSGPALMMPPSPDVRRGGPLTRQQSIAHQSLSDLLPSPAVSFGRAGVVPADMPYEAPSPFSPTKKLKAMSLRSARGEGPGGLKPIGEKPVPVPKQGQLEAPQQHRIKQALQLWEVHSGMGGMAGSAFGVILKREFPSCTPAEIKGIEQAVAQHGKKQSHEQRVAARAWAADEKVRLIASDCF